jgi:Domain of unknown function (DUF4468) with TBP-like fold
MKKLILILALFLASYVAHAQKEVPVTPYPVKIDSITKLITYEGVVEVSGIPAAQLYKRINGWFYAFYKNPSEVIRENDSVKFSITGKPRFRLNSPPSKDAVKNESGVVQYTITVVARDGRYRYELTSFNWKQTSYYACERWLDTKAASYSPAYNFFLLK